MICVRLVLIGTLDASFYNGPPPNTTSCNFTSSQPNVQGHAFIFQQNTYNDDCGIRLCINKIVDRDLTPGDCLGHYLQNTNLHNFPPNCLGVLVPYTVDAKSKIERCFWHLGILIYLHPKTTVIYPCIQVFSNEDPFSTKRYTISDNIISYHSYHTDETFSIIYLNVIHHTSCGLGGYI